MKLKTRKNQKSGLVEKPVKSYYTGDKQEAMVELSVTVSVSGKQGKNSFKNLTVRAGGQLPADLDKMQEAYDAAWDECRVQLKKRFPLLAKTAIELEDE